MEDILDFLCAETETERVLKIVNGLWSGTVRLENDKTDWLVCSIGYKWDIKEPFPFISGMDKFLTPEELRNKYDVFTVARMILQALVNMDDNDYDYCCDVLGF